MPETTVRSATHSASATLAGRKRVEEEFRFGMEVVARRGEIALNPTLRP